MYTNSMHLDRKLHEDIQVHFEDTAVEPDMFGFEIELEGKNLRTAKRDIIALWDIHNDGSLRVKNPGEDAIEYVLRRPLKLGDTHEAVSMLFNHLNQPNVEVFESYRTSIHIHVNCAADPLRYVYNFMTLAVIFDELFVSQNGEHRIGNNFCLRARDAQGQINDVVSSIQHHGNLFNLNGAHRYSSVNFVSLLKFGTVEFRSLECTTDTKRVGHWIDTLAALKRASRQFDDPQDIIRYFSRMSETEFLYFVLGAQAAKYAKVQGYQEMLRDGMRLAQDIAYSASWKAKTLEEKAEKKAKNKYAEAMQLNNVAAEIQLMQNFLQGQAVPGGALPPGFPPIQPAQPVQLNDQWAIAQPEWN